MGKLLVLLLLLFPLLGSGGAHAQIAKETPLITKDLPDVPGRQGLVETVVVAPGEVVPAAEVASSPEARWNSRLCRVTCS